MTEERRKKAGQAAGVAGWREFVAAPMLSLAVGHGGASRSLAGTGQTPYVSRPGSGIGRQRSGGAGGRPSDRLLEGVQEPT
jgi:hypothetical protein